MHVHSGGRRFTGSMWVPMSRVLCAVVCFIIYFLLGFFGAARWGTDTNNNLLVNSWGPPAYQGILNILLGIYLALTNPPLVYPTAHILRVSMTASVFSHRLQPNPPALPTCSKVMYEQSCGKLECFQSGRATSSVHRFHTCESAKSYCTQKRMA